MSRIGKQPISVSKNINININIQENNINIEGPKGKLSYKLPKHLSIKYEPYNNQIKLYKINENKETQKLYGLSRTLINNMIIGVSQGFEKKLTIQGVGYRSQIQGKDLILNVGYSHPVIIEPPESIIINVENNTNIIVKGINKELVGEIAAKIRSVRPPEPYKGKGIRYINEKIILKVGKAGK